MVLLKDMKTKIRWILTTI